MKDKNYKSSEHYDINFLKMFEKGKLKKIEMVDTFKLQKENKDSWSRSEVRGLLIKMHDEFPDRWELENWINDNLQK